MALQQHVLFLAISLTMMVGPQVVEAQQRQHQGPRSSGGSDRPLPLPDEDLPYPGGQQPNRPQQPPQQPAPRPNPKPAPRPNPGKPPATTPVGPGNGYPGQPYPGQPYPGNGNNGGYGAEQKVIYIQRRVINERFNLFALAGVDQRYQGCVVESVGVNVMGSDIRTQIGLIINGQVDQWVNSPQRFVNFVPRYQAVIGTAVRMMEVEVRGMSDIQSITLNIRCQGNGGGGGVEQPGQGFPVNLGIARRMMGNDRLDLAPFFNWQQYRGYRLVAVQFEATSLMNVSFLDFAINGVFATQRVQVGPWNQTYTINPQNAVIGQGAERFEFFSQGQLDIRNVTLWLEKCDNGQHGQPIPPPRPPRPR
jgi:hypothetical protein